MLKLRKLLHFIVLQVFGLDNDFLTEQLAEALADEGVKDKCELKCGCLRDTKRRRKKKKQACPLKYVPFEVWGASDLFYLKL